MMSGCVSHPTTTKIPKPSRPVLKKVEVKKCDDKIVNAKQFCEIEIKALYYNMDAKDFYIKKLESAPFWE